MQQNSIQVNGLHRTGRRSTRWERAVTRIRGQERRTPKGKCGHSGRSGNEREYSKRTPARATLQLRVQHRCTRYIKPAVWRRNEDCQWTRLGKYMHVGERESDVMRVGSLTRRLLLIGAHEVVLCGLWLIICSCISKSETFVRL